MAGGVWHDIRFFVAFVGGMIVAFGLFIVLQWLVSRPQSPVSVPQPLNSSRGVSGRSQPELQLGRSAMPPPPKLSGKAPPVMRIARAPPPVLTVQKLPLAVQAGSRAPSVGVARPTHPAETSGASSTTSPLDGRMTPLALAKRAPPQYPPQAQIQGVTGTLSTCFTVQADGSVADPRVTGASSPQARRMFSRAALQAIRKWKFVPRKEGGTAVATTDVCQTIQFGPASGNAPPPPPKVAATSGHAPPALEKRVQPTYPPKAANAGVAGSIKVCFTVTPAGGVKNPHIADVSSSAALLRAVRKWKFAPSVQNGKPVAVPGVCQTIQFSLGGG